ncbi:DUF3305 domain-containing protein [Balamuthia mandrillaris]
MSGEVPEQNKKKKGFASLRVRKTKDKASSHQQPSRQVSLHNVHKLNSTSPPQAQPFLRPEALAFAKERGHTISTFTGGGSSINPPSHRSTSFSNASPPQASSSSSASAMEGRTRSKVSTFSVYVPTEVQPRRNPLQPPPRVPARPPRGSEEEQLTTSASMPLLHQHIQPQQQQSPPQQQQHHPLSEKEEKKALKAQRKKEKKLEKHNRKKERKERKVRVRINKHKEGSLETTASQLAMGERFNSSEWDLLGEVKKIWNKPVQSLPINSDLPRLTKRIKLEVRTKDFRDLPNEDEKEDGKSNEQKGTAESQQKIATNEKKEEEDVDEIYFDVNTTWYVKLCTVFTEDKKQWERATTWKGLDIDGLVSLVFKKEKNKCKIYVYDQENERMLAEKVDATNLIDTKDSSRYFVVYEDGDAPVGFAFYSREDSSKFLENVNPYRKGVEVGGGVGEASTSSFSPEVNPRNNNEAEEKQKEKEKEENVIAAATTDGKAKEKVNDGDSSKSASPQTAQEEEQVGEEVTAKVENFNSLCRFISSVAKELESDEVQQRIKITLESLKEAAKTADSQVLMKRIMDDGVGSETRSAKLFKAINQSILFAGAYLIKLRVTKELMTKDVRAKEGWRVHVLLAPNAIVVTHVRREMSIGGPQKDDSFWFEWELSITFDTQMTGIEAVWLRIVDLQFGDACSQANKERINQRFCNGQLHVY